VAKDQGPACNFSPDVALGRLGLPARPLTRVPGRRWPTHGMRAVAALCAVGGGRCFVCTPPEQADTAEPFASADQRVCTWQGGSAVCDGELGRGVAERQRRTP